MAKLAAEPQTPPLSSSSQRCFFDSPFSDYHTDSSRSSHSSTTSAQKDILRRLDFIGEMVQNHQPKTQLTRAMHLKLDAVEAILSAPDPQSRLHLEDSGLFLDDEDVKEKADQAHAEHEQPRVEMTDQDLGVGLSPFDIADQIARNVEEHMDYMNQLLDEAKQREQELEDYLEVIQKSKKDLAKRFEEVKRNNLTAIEHIKVLKREVLSLTDAKHLMRTRLVEVEDVNKRLLARIEEFNISQKNPAQSPSEAPELAAASPSKTESPCSEMSRWSSFWDALGEAAGILDYTEIFGHEN